jgi:hypothetical protein
VENDDMSNPFRVPAQQGLPTPARGTTVAQYATYAEAQRAVDFLSDEHFPVRSVTIVGVDLQMVERVTGRLTYGRVAVAGLLSGAWFGLFVGLLLSIFSNDAGGFSVFGAIIIGAAFGMLFGLISYSLTGGRRDFTSTSQIVAGEYRVLCLEEQAGQALQLLNRLPGGPGGSGPGGLGAQVTTVSPAPVPAPPEPGAPPVDPATPAAPEAAPSGPTYSEMMDRKRQEEREAAEREQR